MLSRLQIYLQCFRPQWATDHYYESTAARESAERELESRTVLERIKKRMRDGGG